MSKSCTLSVMADFKKDEEGKTVLHMGRVSEVVTLSDFKETVRLIHDLRPISPDHGKFECFGVVAAPFNSRPHPYLRHVGMEELDRGDGVYYRKGTDEIDRVSFIYIDVDNNRANRKKIKLAKTAAILEKKFGWSFGISTTFSHSPSKEKFRVIIETDRDASRAEIRRVAIYLNEIIFGGQADTTIYDAADFIFAPPYHAKTREHFDGSALNIDSMLRAADAMIALKPHLLADAISVKKAHSPRSNRSKKSVASIGRDMSVDPQCHIKNQEIFNPEWIEAYQQCGSHWKTMRSIMGSIWIKADGGLTYGELDHLLRQVDATDRNYLVNKYGETGIQKLLDWVVSLPTNAANDDWKPLLASEPIDLVIDLKEAACGEGKTFSEYDRMLDERGCYIYASPKKDDSKERAREFIDAAKKRGIKFRVLVVDKDHCDHVAREFLFLKKEKLADLKKGATVIFTTHLGLMMNKWAGWEDFHAIFDEVAEIYKSLGIDATHHPDMIKDQLAVKLIDGDCYRMRLTAKGRLCLKGKRGLDDYERLHKPILEQVRARNCLTWIEKKQWDASGGLLDFFSLFTPLNLLPFRSVRLMGDEASKSPMVKIWAEKWGVVFKPVAGFVPRLRSVSTDIRTTIKYFSEHKDASKKLFTDEKALLGAVSAAINADAAGNSVLWTANEALKSDIGMAEPCFIKPKSNGRNDLQHYMAVAWLAAMKPNPADRKLLVRLCGVSEQEIIDWREYNPMYQASMRTNLRDFASANAVTIYVFSRRQAEYLHSRLGGQMVSLSHALATEHAVTVAPKETPMCENTTKQVRRWAMKMIAAGVNDFSELPDSANKGNVDASLIPLINARAAKFSAR